MPVPTDTTPVPGAVASELTAPRVRYSGGSIIAEGGVVYKSGESTVRAERLEVNTETGQITAVGDVLVEKLTQTRVREHTPKSLPKRSHMEGVLETLRGQNFAYNIKTRQGNVDNADLRLENFALSTQHIVINGQRYEAHNVILRPGALTEADEKIYGKPPFSLRAKKVVVDMAGAKRTGAQSVSDPAAPGSAASGGTTPAAAGMRVAATGAGLYYHNTKILPVPSYILQQATSGAGGRDNSAFRLTPQLSFNGTDGALLTTTVRFPISKDPLGPSLVGDLGLSAKIGVRGGGTLTYPTKAGNFMLRGRKNDIVTTQLTSRIVLDRTPEVIYASPAMKLFDLPGHQTAKFGMDLGMGHFDERIVGGGGTGDVSANRTTVSVVATTRSEEHDGPYVELFALGSKYSNTSTNYRTKGFEVGYYGNVTKRVRGLFSYRSTDVDGATPFRFDLIEIARELRTTFDVSLTPRYIVPIDLRYDLDRNQLRDTRFGLLRNYKTFAYGLTYQTARRELKLEIRQGF